MMGTRFLASEEARVHPGYRDAVLRASETDTVYSQLFDIGWPDAPHRTFRNTTVAAWEEAGRPAGGSRPGEGEVVASDPDGSPVPRYSDVIPLPGTTGDVEALALYMGQSAGQVRRIQPAAEIVEEVRLEAEQTLRRLSGETPPKERPPGEPG